MGKAGRWLSSFFLPGKKGRKAKDKADADCQSAPLPAQAAAASVREKRRWSFRRPGSAAAAAVGKADDGASGGKGPQRPLASSSSHCFSEAEVRVAVSQDQHAVAEVATTAAPVASLPPPALARIGSCVGGGGEDEEAAAAIRIQSAFRSYLARKALRALRGMVRLQAMVRGQLVRRQANVTLRRMQALVDAQRRARAERLRLLVEDHGRRQLAAARPAPSRRSPQHPRSRKPLESVERALEENIKIVEVGNGGAAARRSSSCYSTTTLGRTPAKAELYQKVSPTPSALTDASARTLSGRFDDASLASACESSRCGSAAASSLRAEQAHAPLPLPSYMTNTESSRARARRRSQSAPRLRPSSASDSTAAASPSPSCCEPRPPSEGGGGGGTSSVRRRASLDPLDLPGAPPGVWSGARHGPRRLRARAGARSRRSPAASAGRRAPSGTVAVCMGHGRGDHLLV